MIINDYHVEHLPNSTADVWISLRQNKGIYIFIDLSEKLFDDNNRFLHHTLYDPSQHKYVVSNILSASSKLLKHLIDEQWPWTFYFETVDGDFIDRIFFGFVYEEHAVLFKLKYL